MELVRETERFAVTAAAGALGPVLKKLSSLLRAEYKLHEGTRRDIESMKSDLEPIHDLLGKLWGRSDLDDEVCKEWMAEARELSYDMEDGIDSFTDGLERGGDGTFIQKEGTVSCPVKDFLRRVKDVSKRCGEMQKTADTICNRSSMLTTDPRALFLHKDPSELVGMDENREQLIKLLEKHEMVCIIGFAGMGKTTLADLVYQKIGDEFQCRAFVSLHPNPNMTEILGIILSQVTDGAMSAGSGTELATEQNIINDKSISLTEKCGTEPTAEQNDFIKAISTFLSDKRYMVIIDDIWHWEDWQVIRMALPENNLGCKLIMTTRLHSIAEKCCRTTTKEVDVYRPRYSFEDAERLSAMRLRKSVEATNARDLSAKIAGMFGRTCCPLAVICMSSAWAESHHAQQGSGDDGEWDTWARHVLEDGFLSTPSLKPLVQSLSLDFDDLPIQLRTCLLYYTIYPLDHTIDRGCLVRKWVAEGFASQEEVAEAYFDKLVSMNLLVPPAPHQYSRNVFHGFRNMGRNFLLRKMEMLDVRPIMRAFLVCKAKEDNFLAYNVAGNSSHAKQQIRRLCLTSTDSNLDEDVVSHTRSLVFSGEGCRLDGVPFKAFKKLRVLEVKSSRLENGHLVDICGLIWLRYLVLNGCRQITELPREIGKLQKLETLHVAGTHISQLPTEIGKLQHLRTLDISKTQVREVPCSNDPNPLLTVVVQKIGSRPRNVKKFRLVDISPSGGEWVISSSEAKYSEYLSVLVVFNYFGRRCQVLPVRMLRVAGRHMKVPQWVKQDLCNVCSLDIRLCQLLGQDLEFLKTQMPNLQALKLRLEVLPREPVAITRGGFSKLETFYVDCRLPRVITFKEGAMPKLKHLEFKFYTGTARQDYSMGIMHLPSLESIEFRCSENYRSDSQGIGATIEAVRKEATEHPNCITLYFNDKQSEVFRSGAKWISQADRAIKQQREHLYNAAKRRAEQNKNNATGTSDLSRLEEMEESD